MTKPVFSESNLNCDKHKFERFLLVSALLSVFWLVSSVSLTVESVVSRSRTGSAWLVATGPPSCPPARCWCSSAALRAAVSASAAAERSGPAVGASGRWSPLALSPMLSQIALCSRRWVRDVYIYCNSIDLTCNCLCRLCSLASLFASASASLWSSICSTNLRCAKQLPPPILSDSSDLTFPYLLLFVFPGCALVQARRVGDKVGPARPHHRAGGYARPAQGALQRRHQAERHSHAGALQACLPQVPRRWLAVAVA